MKEFSEKSNQSILLVVDFINDIVSPLSKLGRCAIHAAERGAMDKANQAIAWARTKNILIAHVKVGFSDDYSECPLYSPVFSKAPELNVFKLSTWGCEFHERINIEPQDKIIIKHRISAFYGTDLEVVLRARGITKIYLLGVSTNMAIELTAREAHDRDYSVVILQDACASYDELTHQQSISVLSKIADIKLVGDLQ